MSGFDIMNKMRCAPFPVTVYVILSQDEWDVVKAELKATDEEWLSGGAACCRAYGGAAVISIDPLNTAYDDVSLVGLAIHESVHAFQNLCESIGEENPSSEFEAYYTQSISEFVIRACWEFKKADAFDPEEV